MPLTQDQKEYVINNYQNKTAKQIASDLGVNQRKIECFCRTQHLRKIKNREEHPIWTDEQLQFLKDNYNIYSRNALSKLLNQTPNNVRVKLLELGLTNKKWSKFLRNDGKILYGNSNSGKLKHDDEKIVSFIRDNINHISMKKIEEQTGYTYSKIRRICDRYNIDRSHSNIHDTVGFSEEECKIIVDNYGQIPLNELQKLLPRWSIKSIAKKAIRLHLKDHYMTYPERLLENIFNKNNIHFTKFVREYYTKKNFYEIDFVYNNYAIEVQGDYWHGNPNVYKNLNDLQKKMQNRDNNKKIFLESIGYKVVYIWEYDLINNFDICEQKIKSIAQM
jgi:G:T-mismatch repair DNA endonuclease (very short patch repair protein)